MRRRPAVTSSRTAWCRWVGAGTSSAYDRDRHDWRSFRVDRIREPQLTGARYRPRELPAEDALAFVRTGIASMPMKYVVRVRFAVPAETVAGFVGRWATVEPDGPDGCAMTMSTDTLDWPMMALADIDADFVVEEPSELAVLAARAGERFARSAPSP